MKKDEYIEDEYWDEEYVEFGSPEDLDRWEEYGYESREEYEEYVKNKLEDPLYGYGNVVTMKELRSLLQQDEYKPTGDDANYPDHLLLDEKTGMYYTDFFRDHRTHLILGHILAVECLECENVDWVRVTKGYSPYVVSRFEDICTNPLQWRDGKLVEDYSDQYPEEGVMDNFEWDFDRLAWFAENLPTMPYLPEENNDDPILTLRAQELGLMLKGRKYWASSGRIQWDILTTNYDAIRAADLDNEDPYHTNVKVIPWNKYECLKNFIHIKYSLGVDVVRKLVRGFQYDWRRITTFNEFGIGDKYPALRSIFKEFLFEGMEYYLDEWSKPEKAEEDIFVQPEEKPKVTPEEIFSMRFQRSEEYDKFLHFMEIERNEASNGDWARYALTLLRAKIFVHSPKTFKSWLLRFGELFGRAVPYQDPNKLSRTTCQRDIKVYLPEWAFS